jgi:LPS export ABC transporter protein LptC
LILHPEILKKLSIAVLIAGTALFFSCREKIEIINTSIKEDEPTQIVYDFETSYSDSAILRMRLKSPLMKYYSNMEEPYADFDEGVEAYFYEGIDSLVGQITSNFARYQETKKIWEVRYDVVAINRDGDILETELLFFDEQKDLIYTDQFVRITQDDQIIMGTGMESDSRFDKWQIKNVSATLYIDDE